ncbi:Early nodulin 93 ENOD93 protein [Parasponia andersonii]|uniref:Early nodulin 93 ENOD93 protein n=1 Tax=Parasponia andersonii TaxID=3476 RepID=A0A2P5D3J2_PARAD|nr:Early nodulin 93 ENOD93 protein [Parasponia andersonii]
MGIPSEMRDFWANHRAPPLLIPSPVEERKVLNARQCTQASIASYFITADKTILECARRNSQMEEALRRQS